MSVHSASKLRAAEPSRIAILQPRGDLVERLLLGEALVVGRHAGGDVAGRRLAAQARGVAVDGLAAALGGGDLGQARRDRRSARRGSSSSR